MVPVLFVKNLSVLFQIRMSFILFLIWQPPAFPYRLQYSIIGRLGLNHRVRDVDGCFPQAHRHQKIASRAMALHALEVPAELPSVIKFFTSLCSLITQQ